MDEIAMIIWMISLMGEAAITVLVIIVKEHEREQRLWKDINESLDDCLDETLKELGGNGNVEGCIEQLEDHTEEPKEEKKPPKLTNCKNCGAVLHGNKCEFCDTEYDW